MDSPGAVLLAALGLRDRLDYAGVAALCDPESVELGFRSVCEYLRPRSEAEFCSENPDFPAAQAAAAVAHLNRRQLAEIRHYASGVSTYAEFVALSPSDVYRHWLEHHDFRLEVIRRMRARGMSVPDAAFEPPPGISYEILATEATGDRDVVVTYRMRLEGDDDTSVDEKEHETLRRIDDGRWMLVARSELLQASGSTNTILEGEIADLFLDDPSA
jgi:hypothetical protein